jgi:hypothetical protein
MLNVPSNVVRFERLMYLSLASSVIWPTFRWYAHGLVLIEVLGNVLSLVFMASFIWLAARRRKNWARWVLLVVFIFSTHGYLRILLPHWRAHGPDAFALGLAVQIPAQLVALILIFTGNARDWFKQPRTGVSFTEQSALP